MLTLRRSSEFEAWIAKLRDRSAKAKIEIRLAMVRIRGHFGVTKSLGGGLYEMKVDYGPGYRIYYARKGDEIVILAFGGDKDSQERDIRRAREILARYENA